MRLSPRLLFFVVPYILRAPMKIKILVGIAALGFFGWNYLNKGKTNRPADQPGTIGLPAPEMQEQRP